mmetsp:Transcript_24955/g.36806  ORF Transcript_24955/g.36806 Transcript_24955/m.36806 type:complete len:905 (+) Transcript_24955:149-2863(+)|eukprot:CAMPEP_0185040526 /NCGR_PEP_ID=MMETSP1103-20130426/38706_1 /TAXON_ID=36769 /ORGANISM="Paraphysomonas bandaiensis, Strain Caron Lab Isolate" /LENGTH=904 /DNA_ID=CAMNT_0027579863 /DNA_START=126 /DNA_END=2840 /DNA_ORIENTATION=-
MGATSSLLNSSNQSIKEQKRKNSLNLWTIDEKKEIEEGELILKKGVQYAAEHFYYGVPVVTTRQSLDPLSPVWVRADDEAAMQRGGALHEVEQEWKMIKSVPTTVMITSKGRVVIVFERSSVTYDITIDSIAKAIELNAAVQATPLPPQLQGRTQESLDLYWELPDPPGIAQYVEVQYRRYRAACVAGNPTDPYPWQALVSKTWDTTCFRSHLFEPLKPGRSFEFRLRYRNHKGWSEFSAPSIVYSTLPGVPSTPRPPSSSAILPHATHLYWNPPDCNGAPIERYILEGRAVGEPSFAVLFSGLMLYHVVFNLHPQFAYNFRLKAVNCVGESAYCEVYSIQTPSRLYVAPRTGDWRENAAGIGDTVSGEGDSDSETAYANAQRCPAAWRTYYDHQTRQMFYFNVLTGSRQLQEPVAITLARSLSGTASSDQMGITGQPVGESEVIRDDRERAVERTTNFRLKRFRFMRDLRKHRQETALSLGHEENCQGDSSSLGSLAPPPTSASSVFHLEVDRDCMLAETYHIMRTFRTGGLGGEIRKRLRVTFKGEEGIDAGGLSKEFYLLISRQMLRYAGGKYRGWLRTTESGKLYFSEITPRIHAPLSSSANSKEDKPEPQDQVSVRSVESLRRVDGPSFAHFMGRMLGKALHDQHMVHAPLSGVLLTLMTYGIKDKNFSEAIFDSRDVKDLDSQLHKSLEWMRCNDITDIIESTFTVVGPDGNDVILCKNGDTIPVTQENKSEYIRLMTQWKTVFSVSALLTPFLEGFWELVPLAVICSNEISSADLDLMLNGKPSIDVEEIRAYTIFQGEKDFNDSHPQVIMLWQVVREFEDSLQRSFLKFVTGTSSVPLDGYDPPFNLTQGIDMVEDSLPRAHTCFNQLVIPIYSSVDVMKEKLVFAITETEGFDLS